MLILNDVHRIEAVSSVVYASQRISDLDELATLRNMFSAKFGKTYVEQVSCVKTSYACMRRKG